MFKMRCPSLVMLVALTATALSVAAEPFEIVRDFDTLTATESNGDTTNLPGISEFARGIDYSTGERTILPIFKFTYTQSAEANPDFLFDDHVTGLTYRIPDQLAVEDWVSKCTTSSMGKSEVSSSTVEYLKTTSSTTSVAWDQTTDISVTVPVGPAEVSASTQISNSLGYGQSEAAEDYYRRMRSGESTAIQVRSVAGLWRVQWRRYNVETEEQMRPSGELSAGFAASIAALASSCSATEPDFAGRLIDSGNSLSKTRCDIEAADLVSNFGTHYNDIGRFGGKYLEDFFYNAETATSTQRTYAQEYSEYRFGLLFLGGKHSSSSSETEFEQAGMAEAFTEGRVHVWGGDSSFASQGEWCSSVRRQPTVVTNDKLVPIADLITDKASRFAVMMAISDKWVCNGGTAVNFDPDSGKLECKCPESREHDFYLDEHCLPQGPKCYSGDSLVTCLFGKLIAGYTYDYTLAWNDGGSGGKHDGSLYRPNPPPGYALVGTVAVKGYAAPTRQVILLHHSTPYSIAEKPMGFDEVYVDHGTGADKDGSVWRPVCPDGYTSVSDFGQAGYEWPGNLYRGIELRPCIIKACVMTCSPQWVWDDTSTGGSQDVAFFKMVGTWREYGSDVGHDGGFFRAWPTYDAASVTLDVRTCIKPACIENK